MNSPHRLPSLRVPAAAAGALALGAVALGAFAVARVAVGHLAVSKARFRTLEVDDLTVRRLRIIEAAELATALDTRRTADQVGGLGEGI